MPYEEKVIEGEGYALILSYGEVSAQQRIEVMKRPLQEPAFAPGMSVLVDARQLESTPPFVEFEKIARAQARMLAGHPIAILSALNAKYGVARQAAMLTEAAGGGHVSVFTDHAEAIAWIRTLSPLGHGAS